MTASHISHARGPTASAHENNRQGNSLPPVLFDILCGIPFFSDLTRSEKIELLRHASFRPFKRGEIIYRVGDPITSYLWVSNGIVQLSRVTPNGHELTADIRLQGDMLGHLDMPKAEKRTFNAKAVTDVWKPANPGRVGSAIKRWP